MWGCHTEKGNFRTAALILKFSIGVRCVTACEDTDHQNALHLNPLKADQSAAGVI
jgi:hypothetical protein